MPPEQRAQLVLRLLSKQEPEAQIARRAGISEQTLYRSRDEFIGAGTQALRGRGGVAEQARERDGLPGLPSASTGCWRGIRFW